MHAHRKRAIMLIGKGVGMRRKAVHNQESSTGINHPLLLRVFHVFGLVSFAEHFFFRNHFDICHQRILGDIIQIGVVVAVQFNHDRRLVEAVEWRRAGQSPFKGSVAFRNKNNLETKKGGQRTTTTYDDT
jgi:hypothetical protein